jgi:hypothetical protein
MFFMAMIQIEQKAGFVFSGSIRAEWGITITRSRAANSLIASIAFSLPDGGTN